MIVIVAVVDLERTRNEVPDTPAVCGTPLPPGCQEARNDAFTERLRASSRLTREYEDRLLTYARLALALIAIATVIALVRRPRNAARVFTNLGIAGVWALLGVLVLCLILAGSPVDPSPNQAFMPVWLMLGVAAVGWAIAQLMGLSEEDDGAEAARRVGDKDLRRGLAVVTIALAAAAAMAAVLYGAGTPDCEPEDAPGWADAAGVLAIICILGAAGTGIGSLVARNWLVALIGLAAGPLAIFIVLASGVVCFS